MTSMSLYLRVPIQHVPPGVYRYLGIPAFPPVYLQIFSQLHTVIKMTSSKVIVLANPPKGDIKSDTFKVETQELPALEDGQVLLKAYALGNLPAMRTVRVIPSVEEDEADGNSGWMTRLTPNVSTHHQSRRVRLSGLPVSERSLSPSRKSSRRATKSPP